MVFREEHIEQIQRNLCAKYDVTFYPSPKDFKVGISLNVKDGILPLNGLRHPPNGDTTGWYIWAGEEFCDDADFFKPLHVMHLKNWCPELKKYLGLPLGWRFLVNGDYENVWYDEELLKT